MDYNRDGIIDIVEQNLGKMIDTWFILERETLRTILSDLPPLVNTHLHQSSKEVN